MAVQLPRATADSIPVSIIIDDLGYSLERGRQAIEMPAALTYSILPQTPYSRPLAELAHLNNKEVLLHLPMEGSRLDVNEPDTLNERMPEAVFRSTVQNQLLQVPHVVGVNNHMGSMLTPRSLQMNWLMEELAGRSLFFVDSRTTAATVASLAAQRHEVPFLQRDVFLDNDRDNASIRAAFLHLVRLAKE
ncbi:MAG TPA: divergent polysaccharide deacetylase family protein, partial [Gammaproteobacteria bacterium]